MKLKVNVRCELVDSKVMIQQKVMVEMKERNKQCVECERNAADQTWNGLVQLRQRRERAMEREVCLWSSTHLPKVTRLEDS